MTVRELIELLSKQRPTKRVYTSGNAACVELKENDLIDMPWGVIFR